MEQRATARRDGAAHIGRGSVTGGRRHRVSRTGSSDIQGDVCCRTSDHRRFYGRDRGTRRLDSPSAHARCHRSCPVRHERRRLADRATRHVGASRSDRTLLEHLVDRGSQVLHETADVRDSVGATRHTVELPTYWRCHTERLSNDHTCRANCVSSRATRPRHMARTDVGSRYS